jgi:hypothetical protein
LRILKAAELVAVFGAAAALVTGDLALSLALLLVLGTQAAFSSPVKYALLPQHLAATELVDGNALMEAGTFLSILAGTIAGGVAVAIAWGPAAYCLLLLPTSQNQDAPRIDNHTSRRSHAWRRFPAVAAARFQLSRRLAAGAGAVDTRRLAANPKAALTRAG